MTVAEGARTSQEIRGLGDAEAIRIYADAFGQDAEFFRFYRSMEAYKKSFGQDAEFFRFYRSMEAYKKSFGQDDTMVINPTGDFFRFFELPSK